MVAGWACRVETSQHGAGCWSEESLARGIGVRDDVQQQCVETRPVSMHTNVTGTNVTAGSSTTSATESARSSCRTVFIARKHSTHRTLFLHRVTRLIHPRCGPDVVGGSALLPSRVGADPGGEHLSRPSPHQMERRVGLGPGCRRDVRAASFLNQYADGDDRRDRSEQDRDPVRHAAALEQRTCQTRMQPVCTETGLGLRIFSDRLADFRGTGRPMFGHPLEAGLESRQWPQVEQSVHEQAPTLDSVPRYRLQA